MDEWLDQQPPEAWQTVDVRDGEKGPLVVEAWQRCVETRGARRQAAAQETLVVIRTTDCDSRVVKVDRTRASQKKCAALTLSQLRAMIAAAICRRAAYYSAENVQQRSQRWLTRTILARFYRYRARKLVAPLSLEHRPI